MISIYIYSYTCLRRTAATNSNISDKDIAKLKSEWLSVFPKVTMPGDTHSFAGFSKSPLHRVAQYI